MSLAAKGMVVRFDGVTAVDSMDLEVQRGQIVSVIGPNGSGKSTLFNAISGFVPTQNGTVSIDGKDISTASATERVRTGIARTFQTPRFDPQITVRTAVICGFYSVMNTGLLPSMLRTPLMRRQEADAERDYQAIASSMGLAALSDAMLGELPMGQVRLVEVARAIAARPSYLLLDEPAAGLSASEQHTLSETIRSMAKRGIGVLLVEHNFELVKNLAEHVVVLNRGQLLAKGTASYIAQHPDVIDVYLGGETV
jgi:ABC-type branched-subunit amino acid transport system ATPase component